MENLSRFRGLAAAALAASCIVVAACMDTPPTGTQNKLSIDPSKSVTELLCTASISARKVSCAVPAASSLPPSVNADIFGGQNTSVKLTSSNVSYDTNTNLFEFDVTVQNLNNEAIGTPDGVVPATDGIQIFFANGPTVTSGSGSITVNNPEAYGTFTGPSQPYFTYREILKRDEVSAPQTWKLAVPPSVDTFIFGLLVSTDIQYLLVINEVLANPSGMLHDTDGDWFELYNAGSHTVNLEGLYIADSAASGRRPYHLIDSENADLKVAPGGYFVLGQSSSDLANGGAGVQYSYGSALNLAPSLDAVKIARVYGTDTLTIDRTQYANASISAQDGISRELKNPALDNSNMDGSNWGAASVTSVYGTGGRGTPRAQNSSFSPDLITTGPILGSLLVEPAAPSRRRRGLWRR